MLPRISLALLCLSAGVSSLIALPVPQAGSSPAVQSERTKLLDKVREVNRWGPQHRIADDVGRELDKVIASNHDADIVLGWGLTNDGNAYRLKWKENKFSFDKLSADAAGALGFQQMEMSVKQHERPAAAAPPTPPAKVSGSVTANTAAVASERDRLIQKVREVNRWGPQHRIADDVAKELDKAIAAKQDADVLLGWGLTNDGNAYRLKWKDNKFSFDQLTPEAATAQGVTRMDMSVKQKSRTTPGR